MSSNDCLKIFDINNPISYETLEYKKCIKGVEFHHSLEDFYQWSTTKTNKEIFETSNLLLVVADDESVVAVAAADVPSDLCVSVSSDISGERIMIYQ